MNTALCEEECQVISRMMAGAAGAAKTFRSIARVNIIGVVFNMLMTAGSVYGCHYLSGAVSLSFAFVMYRFVRVCRAKAAFWQTCHHHVLRMGVEEPERIAWHYRQLGEALHNAVSVKFWST